MKCPACGRNWPAWHLIRLTEWHPIACPGCGAKAARGKWTFKAWLSIPVWVAVALPLWAHSEGLISSWAAAASIILFFALGTMIDAATIQLVPAEAKKFPLRRMLILTAIWIVMPVIALPITIYVSGVLPSDCHDWSRSLRQGRSYLRACDDPKQRYYALGETAKAAAELRSYDEARRYATELLLLAPRYPRDWNYGNAIHDGHMVLGRVAVAHGDLATARRELLLAGSTPGSPQLDSFGPNMALANDLLRAGERDTVFRYFDECERFWEFGHGPIARWKTLARFHLPPDFGANLLY